MPATMEELFAEAEAEVSEGGEAEEGSTEQVEEGSVADTPTETEEETSETVAPAEASQEPAPTEAPWWEGIYDAEPTPEELKKGVLRQADYTKKTQELANVRRAAEWAMNFQAALEKDPQGALRALAVSLKLLPEDDQGDFNPDEIDPALERAAELEKKIQALEHAEQVRLIRAEIDDVRHKYDDFNEEQVLALVAQMGSEGRGVTIEEGYLLWAGQRSIEQRKAAVAAKTKADAEAARAAEAAAASGAVGGGHSPASATVEDDQKYRGKRTNEAIEAIFDDLFPEDF